MKKSSSRKFLLRIGLVILLIFLGLFALVSYWYYDEMRSNDSLPISLSSDVSIEKLTDEISVSDLNIYEKASNICSQNEKTNAIQFLKDNFSQEYHQYLQEKYVTCHKFTTSKGIFYDIFPGIGCRATLLLEKTPDSLEYVIRNGSSKDPEAGYPCNVFKVLQVNNDNIIISFSGWQNPRKLVKLTIH